ncbi:MAG: dTDP-4-dehydrorhamnose reductase [Anaerolineales bacterium]|nr:dTDP-4-dehydrorhamnose reductase [Anaerolineales bacterium]
MHVLMTGGGGQLGNAVEREFSSRSDVKVTVWTFPGIDITEPATVDRVADLAPDLVINAAAWTNVDAAEADPDATYATNTLGAKYLAEGSARCGAAMVQISTNEVFPGEPGVFYREYDQTAARSSIYARSKLAGERATAAMTSKLYIVRVAWLFGPGGNNFPTKIVGAADKNGVLRVVDDEFGNPTYAPDVAAALAELVQTGRYGIYHLVNDGYCSRFDWAREILQHSGRIHVPVTAVSSSEWRRPTQPPPHAVMVNQAGAALGIRLRPWQEAVAEYCGREFVAVP